MERDPILDAEKALCALQRQLHELSSRPEAWPVADELAALGREVIYIKQALARGLAREEYGLARAA